MQDSQVSYGVLSGAGDTSCERDTAEPRVAGGEEETLFPPLAQMIGGALGRCDGI